MALPAGAFEFEATRFRFKPTKVKSGGTAVGTAMQFSEFKFRHNGADVPWGTATLTQTSGTNPVPAEALNNIKDGSTNSKWYTTSSAVSVLSTFYVTFPTATKVDSYAFATANDALERDPVSWELAYTNVTGTPVESDWIKIDVRTNYATTINRYTWSENFVIPQDLPPEIFSFVAQSPDGGVTPTSNVVLNGSQAGLFFAQIYGDTYSIAPAPGPVDDVENVVTPPSNKDTEYTLSVTNTTGTLTAKQNLRAVAGGTVAYKYIRFRPTLLRGTATGTTQIQVADLTMYANGTPVLAKAARNATGADNTYANATTEGPNKIRDNTASTKWLSATATMNVILDMTDAGGNAMPFDSYSLTTGNDAPDRTPIRWAIDGANDDTASTVWTRIDDLTTWDVSMPTLPGVVTKFPMPGGSLPPLVNSFTADAIKIVAGEPITFNWSTTDAATVTLTPSPGAVSSSGALTLYPTESATFTLTAKSPAGFETVRTLPLTVLPASTPTTINYPNFDTENGAMALVGIASVVNDTTNFPSANAKRLRLTPDITGMSGAAWFARRVPTSAGFDTTFAFQLSKSALNLTGADGVSFVVQDNVRGNGAAPTEKGIQPVTTVTPNIPARALNFQFDTFYSTADGDVSNSAATFQIRNGATSIFNLNLGTVSGLVLNTTAKTPVNTPPSLTGDFNTAPHVVRIRWVPNLLNVWIDNIQILTNLSVDLAAIGAYNAEGKSWVGFGSRTGGYSQYNDITSWSLTSDTIVPSLPLEITGYLFNLTTGQGSLVWKSAPGKTYRITTGSPSLNLSSWPDVLSTGIPSGGTETSANFSFTPGIKGFFRVEEVP